MRTGVVTKIHDNGPGMLRDDTTGVRITFSRHAMKNFASEPKIGDRVEWEPALGIRDGDPTSVVQPT